MSIEPTEDVADTPVNVIISVIAGEIAPTEDVVESPVKVNETSIVGDSIPNRDNSNPCPTNPTVCASNAIAPTEDVADTPVKICASLILTDPTEDVVETPVNGIKFSTVVVSEPTAEVALVPAGVKLLPAKTIKLLREVASDCPDKVSDTSVRGASAPTADVVDKPVSKCVSLMLTAPTDDVVESPVGINERLPVGANAPTEDVVESPVNGIKFSTAGESAPIEDVVNKPVNDTSREDSPQFSKPQESDPQPAKFSTVIESEPLADVVESPVRVKLTSACSPYAFCPQVVPDWFQVLAIRSNSLCYSKYSV